MGNQTEIFREEMMKLSPWDFDQSPLGWRKFDSTNEFVLQADLIKEYISLNKEKIVNPKEGERKAFIEVMFFHIGQLLASSGKNAYPEAIEMFKQSYRTSGECWNAYVSATIGFLENNIKEINKAIEIIENSSEENKLSGNIDIVKNFKTALEEREGSYYKVYRWPRG